MTQTSELPPNIAKRLRIAASNRNELPTSHTCKIGSELRVNGTTWPKWRISIPCHPRRTWSVFRRLDGETS